MKKIPTIFERDWDGDRSRVLDIPNPECTWVFDGEGVPTVKLDGTCCLIKDGTLFKRREVKIGNPVPDCFIPVSTDPATDKTVGWVPVGIGPDDQWHREAWSDKDHWADGTYELIGPKIQGNPEGSCYHLLIKHGGGPAVSFSCVFPRTFESIRDYLKGKDCEGLVFHHPDGRMGKIKKRDFGMSRNSS